MRLRNNTFVLKERFPTYLSPRLKPVYHNQIVKAMVEQCGGDLFFGEGIPVSIEIEIMSVRPKTTKLEKENQINHTGFPKVSTVLAHFMEALKGAAYISESQVADVFITKVRGNEDRIRVTISRL